ncbi:MAG: PhzF family phenazine biosynthesis protein [Sulfobacillus sp.]|nr:PhzF family phenazine biosynthesis protein [Sulfobacillus sp.]
MAQVPYYIVDVFTDDGPYSGNPLAVVLEAESLTDLQMQQIAAELRFSETTFVLPRVPGEAAYPVRIFTPRQEIPFAGHPAIGTAFVIHSQKSSNDDRAEIPLRLEAGLIPITYDADSELFRMPHQPPTFGPILEAAEVTAMLGLTEDAWDARYPVQEVSTGLPTLIVPLASLDAVQRVQLDRARYDALMERLQARTVLVFSAETLHPDHHVHVRVFGPAYGVEEDPATGSANGCLAAFLAHYRYFNTASVNVVSEQGMEIDRPSILYLSAEEGPDHFTVSVAGRVHPVAYGRWWVADEADPDETGKAPTLSL